MAHFKLETGITNQDINIRTYSSVQGRVPWLSAVLMIAYGFNSAVGTNLSMGWYYIHPGISYIDLVIVINFLLLVNFKSGHVCIVTSKVEKTQAFLLCVFSSWLIISTCINMFRFETCFADLLPAFRLIYFIVLIHVIRKYAERFGVVFLINGFIVGVVSVFWQSFVESQTVLCGVPILWNPNVIGAIIALGIFFSAMSLSFGQNLFFPLFASFVFFGGSLMTWSKGTWLMSITGLLIVILSLFCCRFRQNANMKKIVFRRVAIGAFLLAIIYVFMSNYETVKTIFDAKISSTRNIQSVDMRFNLILASIFAGVHNPIFGLGFRNFYQAQNYSTELSLPLMDSSWNAHNVFFQILATGGIPAFLILIALFLFPFIVLRRLYLRQIGGGVGSSLILLLSLGVWFICGSVQLQLIAQPPFWFFCGLIFGVHAWRCPLVKTTHVARASM